MRLRPGPAFNVPVVIAFVWAVLASAGAVVTAALDFRTALSGHAYEDVITALVWSALGGLLAVRAKVPRFGALFLTVGSAAAIAVAAGAYAQLAVAHQLPAAVPAAWTSGWIWTVSTFVPVTLVPLWFPDGHACSRRWDVAGYGAVVGLTLLTAGVALGDRVQLTSTRSVPSPVAMPGAGVLFGVGAVLLLAGAVAAMTSIVRLLALTTGERRRQIAPVVAALAVSLVALPVAAFVPGWGPLVQLLTLPLVPVAIVVAVFRFRLYELEVVVRRSVVFICLTVLIVGGYALVVAGTAGILHRQAGLPESLVAAGAVALVFQPARDALQRAVGRWLYGERTRPQRSLAAIGEQLAGAADPAAALDTAVNQVRSALRLPWVAVFAEHRELAGSGVRPGWTTDDAVVRIALVHLGSACGELQAVRRSPRERLSAADLTLLTQLAVPVAAVVSAGRLIDDLRRSRERVVLAREEERRRLRRDLHDGLGPLLSAIVTQADVASLRLERGSDDTAGVVERLRRTSSDAITSLRQVVEGLRPADIDELGLEGALREFAAAMSSGGGVQVQLSCDALPPLPAAVELAAYRIVGEAVANAVRHASPGTVTVSVRVDEGVLRVEVGDDGTGFSPGTTTSGLGLQSMRERAEELGGVLQVSSGVDGTRVRAMLAVPDGLLS